MNARIPFMSLAPGEDAADIRAGIDRVIARGWCVATVACPIAERVCNAAVHTFPR